MIKVTPKKTKTSVILTISVDEQFIAPYKQAVLKRLKKDVKAAGFRPGMAPDNIVEREVGTDRIQAEVLEEVLMHAYTRAVRDEGLETIASPKVSMKKFVPYSELEFEAEVAIMPEIKLNLAKIKTKQPEVKVDKKEIDETLENIRQQSAKKVDKVGAIAKGDEVKFDFTGVKEGKPVEGASATNHVLTIGDGNFIPGFEDNMMGLKKSEKKTFTVTFPKDYHAKDLAGQPVEFTVTIHEIKAVDLPKLDDAWAKTVGPVQDLKQLKSDIEKTLEQNKQAEATKAYESEVLEKVVTTTTIDLPQTLVDEQVGRLREETEQNLKNSGLDLEKYLQLRKQSQEEFDKELATEAEKRVKLGMILRHIVEDQKLSVTEEEVVKETEHLREHYTDPEMSKHIDHDHFKDDLRNHLMTQKAVAYLVEQAQK